MAETYSAEYTALYITKPAAKVSRSGVPLRAKPFHYGQVLTGTAEDTCIVEQLPPCSMLFVPLCVFYHEGFTSGMTLSVGWKAYTDNNGVVQAASATGIFNAADVSNTTGMLHGGMDSSATPDDFNPVATAIAKDFNNRTPIDIYVTFGGQVPGASAILNGVLVYAALA